MPSPSPLDSVVRILNPNGKTAGTAFFAGHEGKLVTCAHVVKAAGSGPGGTVRFVCYREPGREFAAKVLDAGWGAPEAQDVAVLEPVYDGQEAPAARRGVALGSSYNAVGQTLHTFGFPAAKPVEGLNGKCEVIGRVNENGFEVLQLRSSEVSFGFSGAPAWRPETSVVVGMVVSIISAGRDPGGRQHSTAFLIPVETIRGTYEGLRLEGDCPYRGLEPFEEEHKDVYFGRDEAVEEMIVGLSESDIVAISGISGSGKSSLVRAGLAKGLERWPDIPALSGSRRVLFKPGVTPLDNLLVAVSSLESPRTVEESLGLATGALAESISRASEVLREKTPSEIAALLRGHFGGAKVLLVVDQFERLFTDCHDASVRSRFMDVLLAVAGVGVKLLLTVREDFLGSLEHHDLGKAISDRTVMLTQMEEDELKSAIVRPAQALGRELEPDLIEQLITDVRGRPGDLPLLEFALKELWKIDGERGVLTVAAYNRLGELKPGERVRGVRGAIIKRADAEWDNQRRKGHEEAARRILLSLVTPTRAAGDAPVILDTSRRAQLAEFDPLTRGVAQELADSFLLTTSEDPLSEEPIIEVSHEALIKNWPLLQRLVNDHRPFLLWFVQDFSPYFQGWLAEKDPRSKKTLILPDVLLREALEWQKVHPRLLVGPRADYINESVARHRRRLLYRVFVAAAVLVAALVAGFTYYNANLSHGAELHERGVQALLQHDYQQAQLLLAESLQYSDSDEARKDLLEARVNGAKALPVRSLPGLILDVTGDGSRLAFRGADGAIKVWDREHDVETTTGFVVPEADARSARVALSPRGALLAYGDGHGRLQLWDLSAGRAAPEPPPSLDGEGQPSAVDSIAVSPDESLVAYGNVRGIINVWERAPGGAARKFAAHDGAVHCLSFSPATGRKLASGGADSSVKLFDLTAEDGKPVSLGYHDDFVTSVAFNSTEDQLASGSADASVRVWNLQSGSEAYMLTGHLGSVTSVSFNPEGNLLLSGSEDKTVRLWDATIRREILKLKTYGEGAVEGAAFTTNAFRIVSGGRNGDVRLWELGTRPEGMTVYHTSNVGAVAFYPDNRRLVFGDGGGNVYAWDMQTRRQELLTKVPSGAAVDSLAFSDNGLLAVGAYDGSIQVLDTTGQPKLKQSFTLSGPVWGLAFQPSGRWIAAGGGTAGKGPTNVHLWDVETGREVRELSHDQVSVWNLSFSSDGQMLASGGGDKKIRLWNMGTLQMVAAFSPREGDELWAVLFGKGDKTIATAGLDRKVKIWSLSDLLSKRDAEPVEEYSEHEGIIQSAAISRSGEFIATASADHTVGLWDVKTGRKLRLNLHVRPIWWVTFSRDEKFLATGSIDRRVRVSNLDSINHVLAAPYAELLREARADTCLDMRSESEIRFSPCRLD